MGLYRDQGIVLRTIRLGESDRIISLLTAGRGKVRAVAKGVRKTRSRFGSRLEPLAHVSLLMYEGRELDIVTQAESIEHFRPVRENLDRLAKASSLLEAADQLAQERHANHRLYTMLLGALRALAQRDSPLLVPAFFLKLVSLEGFHPVVDQCALCGREEPGRWAADTEAQVRPVPPAKGAGQRCRVAFDIASGGILCPRCAGRGVRTLGVEGLGLIRQILGGDLNAALATAPGRATDEVAVLAIAALEHHLERRLRSVGVTALGR